VTGLPSRSLRAGRLTDYEIRRELADEATSPERRAELEAEQAERTVARASIPGLPLPGRAR
jgi:hypothetical protein